MATPPRPSDSLIVLLIASRPLTSGDGLAAGVGVGARRAIPGPPVVALPSGRMIGPSSVYPRMIWAVLSGPSLALTSIRVSSSFQLPLRLKDIILAQTSTSSGRHGS